MESCRVAAERYGLRAACVSCGKAVWAAEVRVETKLVVKVSGSRGTVVGIGIGNNAEGGKEE